MALRHGGIAALLLLSAPEAKQVDCRVPGDPEARVFTFSSVARPSSSVARPSSSVARPSSSVARPFRAGEAAGAETAGWHLALRSRKTGASPVRVALPAAQPRFEGGDARLSYRSANGGVIVELDAGRERSSLDIYVSYELEVNIDASLDPKVDLLNTNGPLSNARCEVK